MSTSGDSSMPSEARMRCRRVGRATATFVTHRAEALNCAEYPFGTTGLFRWKPYLRLVVPYASRLRRSCRPHDSRGSWTSSSIEASSGSEAAEQDVDFAVGVRLDDGARRGAELDRGRVRVVVVEPAAAWAAGGRVVHTPEL